MEQCGRFISAIEYMCRYMGHAVHMPLNLSSYSIIQAMKSVHGLRGKGRMTKSKMLSWMWRHMCDPSIRESEAGGQGVQGQLWLYGEFEGNPDYARHCHKTQQKEEQPGHRNTLVLSL